MPGYNHQNRDQRITNSDERVRVVISKLQNGEYDLSPLEAFGIVGVEEFINTFGQPGDFAGYDIILNPMQKTVQDRFRTSWVGADLGIEFSRQYELKTDATIENRRIIIDGGRDLWRIYRDRPIEPEWVESKGIWRAVRNWEEDRTRCDFYLLHTVQTADNADDFIFIKADVVKRFTEDLYHLWEDRVSQVLFTIQNNVFIDNNTSTFNGLLDTVGKGIDIKCLRELKDKKNAKYHGGLVSCRIAKTIAYLPYYRLFQEGTDYVICKRRR